MKVTIDQASALAAKFFYETEAYRSQQRCKCLRSGHRTTAHADLGDHMPRSCNNNAVSQVFCCHSCHSRQVSRSAAYTSYLCTLDCTVLDNCIDCAAHIPLA